MIRQTMIITYVFIASLLALCVSVEGGNIRGKQTDRIHGDNVGGEGAVVTTTIASQPSPTNPPTPSQYEIFLGTTCPGQAFSLSQCMGVTSVPPADCYRCIFSRTTVGSSNVNRCLNVCGGSDGLCKPEAITLLNCGNGRISEPTTARTTQPPVVVPVPVPIPSPATPPPPSQGTTTTTTTTNPPVDNFTTMDDCPPDLPTSGDQCFVPSGFLYQSCDYTATTTTTTTTTTMTRGGGKRVPRCSCRADEGMFMCYTVPFLPPTSAPTQQPVTPVAAVTTQSPTTTMPISAPIVAPITAPITAPTVAPTVAPIAATPPPVPSSPFKNDLPLHCYVAGMEDNIQQLPQTGDSCLVPDDIEYGNCVFGVNDPDGVYLYIVYRCLCNPRKLPDETYRDKFICNVIINEPF